MFDHNVNYIILSGISYKKAAKNYNPVSSVSLPVEEFLIMQNSTKKPTKIPASLERLFQEYEFKNVDVNSYANTIIERTLELGTWEELHWLFHYYGLQRIIEYLKRFGDRRLSKITFNYWRKLLEIKEYRHAPFEEIRADIWRVT